MIFLKKDWGFKTFLKIKTYFLMDMFQKKLLVYTQKVLGVLKK
jgi:hypothetical protein